MNSIYFLYPDNGLHIFEFLVAATKLLIITSHFIKSQIILDSLLNGSGRIYLGLAAIMPSTKCTII